MWFLIENNSQKVFEFKSKKELKEFAKRYKGRDKSLRNNSFS